LWRHTTIEELIAFDGVADTAMVDDDDHDQYSNDDGPSDFAAASVVTLSMTTNAMGS
jgi:hypothetical protein